MTPQVAQPKPEPVDWTSGAGQKEGPAFWVMPFLVPQVGRWVRRASGLSKGVDCDFGQPGHRQTTPRLGRRLRFTEEAGQWDARWILSSAKVVKPPLWHAGQGWVGLGRLLRRKCLVDARRRGREVLSTR